MTGRKMKSNKWLTIVGIVVLLSVGIGLFWYFSDNSFSEQTINVYMFYSEDEKQSKRARAFLENYVNKHENIELIKYDVWKDSEAREIIDTLDKRVDIKGCGIPLVIVGEKGVIGYLSDGVSGNKIIDIIESCGNDCYMELDEIEKLELEYEPTIAPINRPEDENKEDDVC
jgi:hypothetical protein